MNKIIFPLNHGMQGNSVADLQEALVFLIDKNIIKTFPPPNHPVEELRRLVLELNRERQTSSFGNATRQIVHYFQIQQGLGDIFSGSVETKTAIAFNQLLNELGAFEREAVSIITGTIYDSHNSPISHASVQAFDKDLRSEQLVGQVETNDAGEYTIRYNVAAFAASEHKTADIFIRVMSPAGLLLGESDVYFNVPAEFTLDFRVDKAPIRELNEFDALVKKISPLLDSQHVNITDIQENEQFRDISFLSRETGEDFAKIAFLPAAFTLSEKTRVAADIFYGLFRLNFPTQLNDLLLTRGESIAAGIQSAIDENIISEKFKDQIESIVQHLTQLATSTVLSGSDTHSASFRQVLGIALPQSDLQQVFVSTYLSNEDNPEKFWDVLSNQPEFSNPNLIPDIKSVLKLSVLTNNLPALTNLLFSEQQQNPDLKDLSGFAAFSFTDWHQRINQLVSSGALTEFPQVIEGNTPEEKASNYATSLTQLVKELYPAGVFASELKKDTVNAFGDRKTDIITFLSNNTGYDLKTNDLVTTFENSNLAGIRDKESLKKELIGINRLYKIADEYKHVSTLRLDGVDSATALVRKYSPAQFTEKFSGTIGPEAGLRIYKNAQKMDNLSAVLAMSLKTRSDIPVYAINGSAINEMPDYVSMFGDTNCDCEHCQSVYSPAAYFTDILNITNRYSQGAFARLTSRRPDLVHILLNCKNTNTPLPYIDLVNELLENTIVPVPPVVVNGIETYPHCQTNNSAEELLAYPEHINYPAYDKLRSANSAFNLSLNLPLEETRICLEKAGVERYSLMEIFNGKNPGSKYNNLTIATEYLRLSPEELNLVNGTTQIPVPLGMMSNFLQDTEISYTEALQLLECYFINPLTSGERSIKIISTSNDPASCKIEDLKLVSSEANSLKIKPFLRLWKKLGWNMLDLDRAFTALNITDYSGDINTSLIIPLSHIARFKQRFNLGISVIVSLWASLDTKVYVDHPAQGQPALPTLYDSLFRNKKITNPPDPDFDLPANLSGTLSAKSGIIMAAFNLTQKDFDALSLPGVTDGNLNLTNLSVLYRHAVLAKALKLTVADLISLMGLTGIHPFGNSTDTLLFTDKVSLIRSSGFSIPALVSFLTVPAEQKTDSAGISKLLLTIREGLKKIELLEPVGSTPQEQAQNKLNTQSGFIGETLATAFKTDSIVTDTLINRLVKSSGDNTKPAISPIIEQGFIKSDGPLYTTDSSNNVTWLFPDVFNTYVVLGKTWNRLSLLMSKLKFSGKEFVYFQNNEASFHIGDLWKLPDPSTGMQAFTAFENFYKLICFRNALTKAPDDWFKIFGFAISGGNDGKENFIRVLGEMANITQGDLTFLLGTPNDTTNLGYLEYAFNVDYFNGELLTNVIQCAAVSAKLGGSAETVVSLTVPLPDASASTLACSLLKAKYDIDAWFGVLKPLSNVLRIKKRDALISYLLTSDDSAMISFRQLNKITDVNALYGYFLIDPEMDPCMLTSRIKQAISSVQLFVDRCLMNLEEGIVLNNEFSLQWNTWRKRYRIWEANRKVFLYPENWIEPELRDDKTPFFKDLETKLRQSDMNEDTARDALLEYLSKLDEIANLEMSGLYSDPASGIVHVIGRSRNSPHKYFYAHQYKNVWSAFEKIDVDIEGEHILPLVWNNRFLLFWVILTEKEENKEGFSVPATGDVIPPPLVSIELKLAWSELKNGKWISKKVSKDVIVLHSSLKTRKNLLSLTSFIENQKLFIRVFFDINASLENGLLWNWDGQAFVFDGCNSAPAIVDTNNSSEAVKLKVIQRITSTRSDYMSAWENDTKDSFSLLDTGIYKTYPPGVNETVVLGNTPGKFRVQAEQHAIETAKPVKFFFNNENNNFYVKAVGGLNRHIFDNIAVITEAVLTPRIVTKPTFQIKKFDTVRAAIPAIRTDISGISNIDLVGNTTFPLVLFRKRYAFQTFYHPYVCDFIKILNSTGIEGLYKSTISDTHGIPKDGIQNKKPQNIFVPNGPYNPSAIVHQPYPVEQVDFNYSGVYSVYNWELFYHIPMLIATRLSQNQKFDEARKWFHYIFDPTRTSAMSMSVPEKFWITKPFKEEIAKGIKPVQDLLNEASPELYLQLQNWEQNPFNPHAVARLRNSAYMRSTVMKYIDNLITWGDQLFRQDTLETINEATQLYILAANLLGKKPAKVPPRAIPGENSFSTIQGRLDSFSNAMVKIQSFISLSGTDTETSVDSLHMPLFCIPGNEQLLGYWDKVADRLFKIRHCLNIEGIFRQLPLFEPPIDPALLVKGIASGLSLDNIIQDMNMSLPHYRFQVMLQKAFEICSDVKKLGDDLMSALEKKDAEQITLLRSRHELSLLEVIRDIKKLQSDEAKKNLESLQEARGMVEAQKEYYESRDLVNVHEAVYLASIPLAMIFQNMQLANQSLATIAYAVPDVTIGPFSSGATHGGNNIGNALTASASSFGQYANMFNTIGSMANVYGGYRRRKDEWDFQAENAELELKQIGKQLAAAEIRLAIAEKELENHDITMEQSREVDDFLRNKFTNDELYDYMIGQLSAVYFQSYQLAFGIAKKAEKCFQHELGVENTSFISFGYWDSLKKGLLSGEKLQYDLRRMENAFLEQNAREYEITRHVSISLLDPLALIKLRSTGSCEFNLPEVLFDMDYPGQYFRRIKSVSISIPCIVGPYTSVGAKLSLLSSRYRKNNNPDNSASTGYQEDPGNDDRFVYKSGVVQSIAASTSQRDSGTFELNFHDDRYLPFEGSGAISSWSLELPSEIAMFDYNTISDVILHINYTSREGGTELKNLSNASMKSQLATLKQKLSQEGIIYAINVKNDKPNEWHLLKKNGSAEFVVERSSLPYFMQPLAVEIGKVMFIARLNTTPSNITISINGTDLGMERNDEWKVYMGTRDDITFNSSFRISIPSVLPMADLQELILALNLGVL